MDEKIKNRKSVIKICISIFAILLIGVSIAYFIASAQSSEQTITTGNLDLLFTETNTIILTNNLPINDEDVDNEASSVKFTVKNTGNIIMYANIFLDSITISNNLKSSDFKWALYDGSTKIATGDFLNASASFPLINNQQVAIGATKEYTVRIWIKENDGNQNSLTNGSFRAKVTVKGYSNIIRTTNTNY